MPTGQAVGRFALDILKKLMQRAMVLSGEEVGKRVS
jgi:hypothetical protein